MSSRSTPRSARKPVGPFCYLRPGTVLGPRTKAGAFVEIKKSIIGQDSKVPHLSPIGDAEIGEDTNIDDSITANFPHRPGLPKGKTTIGSNVRVAVDTLFVAPVTIGDDAWTAAGPSSPTTSRTTRSRASRPGRSTRKDAVESGTIEQTLPGLEGAGGTAPQLMIGRALSLTPQKRLAVVAGSSHPELATKIAGHLGVELTRVEHSTFADGSPYFRFEDSVRGADMFIVQTAAPSIGEHLMELLIMVNAAKLASAKRITAVIPWYFYARQDKKSRPREPITARLVADLLETAASTA